MVTYIKCERCWKEMIKKGKRKMCIRCTNLRNKEVQEKYREEHREQINLQAKIAAKIRYANKKESQF